MAKNMDFLVCLLIMALDIIAGVLGIQGEVALNKVQNLRVWIFECRDPSYEAFKLGLAAVVMLCLAHIVANLLAGCVFISSKEELDRASPNKQLAAASLMMSWIMLGIAFILLISGVLSNSKTRKNCGMSHQQQLSIGGILCFIHGLFAVAYYVSAAAVLRDERNPHQQHNHAHQPKPDQQPLPA
ncbi:hypothetical protein SASPL_144611 [Salvia splendens]|uniref:Uncharacterized protein n=1 Tax=Salvia splendens TaxID=180675 RepID=A0A8X8WF45_SALSN|nr:uncharacterized protein LOC121775430 [Salvia splendens]KAG6394035.1 hypothetical protein SASPL_144611 [Salvia splendens]